MSSSASQVAPLRPEFEGDSHSDLRSEAVLKAIGPNQTEVSYLLDIDPGGSLPAGWLNGWSKNPHLVLKKLQKQIVKTKGYYGDFIEKYGAPIEPVKK